MNRFQRARRILASTVIGALMMWAAPVGTAMADDGDSFPAPAPGTTDPADTAHRTTFDNIAPEGNFSSQFLDSPCTEPGTGYVDPQWRLVSGDSPVALEGQVTGSKIAWDDNPIDHHSRDRNFFVAPDDAFSYLMTQGNFLTGEDNEHGRMEVEWESAAYPAWALPMSGDRVHVEGSYIWDCAHHEGGYRTEIHPPRLVMTLRDAAGPWQKDCQPSNPPDPDCVNGKVTIPERPGWADTMPGLGSVPVQVTRADVFASSDGGEAREQLTCFSSILLPPPPGCPPDWYQDIRGTYDLFVPAPPRPDPDAQLVTKLIPRPFLTCSSDNDCGGAVDELKSDPEMFTFTEQNTLFGPGVAIHVNLVGQEPPSLLYGFGFTFEVGWNRVAKVVPRRVKVTIEGVHVANTTDSGADDDMELEVSSLIGDTFRHMVLTGGPKQVEYNSHWDVPDTEEVNVGNYGVKSSGSECALDASSGADPGPCQNQFDVVLLPGQPLRVFFRAEEQDPFKENDELGGVERIATEATNYDIGEHTEWFQERTSAGDDALDSADCGFPNQFFTTCLRITYKIEDDPIPAPATTKLTTGQPTVMQGGATWLTSASDIVLQATAPNGPQANDALEIHERFWRSGTPEPADSICGPGGNGIVFCTLHLNANDGADGPYNLEYWSVDKNTQAIEAPQTATFQLDNTAPATSASLAGTLVRGWFNTPVTVTLPATDGAGVGVDHTTYSVDGGASVTYGGPFVISGDSSSHTVLFSSADKLTNVEPAKSTSFKIDTTPPALGVNSASDGAFTYTQNELLGGMFTNATSLTLSYATSDGLSGVYAVRLDGTTIASSGSANATAIVALPAGISTHTLVAEDVAGNLTTLTFQVVSVPPGTFAGGVAPQGAGFWKNAVSNGDYTAAQLGQLLAEVDVASRAFGAPDNRYLDATLANYQSYLAPGANPTADQLVRRELLTAWLNLVSGREPAAQKIDVKSVPGWPTVVTDTSGSSVTTALNLVRESERRLEGNPTSTVLDTTQSLLEKLNASQLNK